MDSLSKNKNTKSFKSVFHMLCISKFIDSHEKFALHLVINDRFKKCKNKTKQKQQQSACYTLLQYVFLLLRVRIVTFPNI